MALLNLANISLKANGMVLDASTFYALAGDTKIQELFVVNLEDLFTNNLNHFLEGRSTNVVLVGAYYNKDSAHRAIESIKKGTLHGPGLIATTSWHLVMANIAENRLFALRLNEYYVGCFGAQLFNIQYANMALGIFDTKHAAEAAMDRLRYSICGKALPRQNELTTLLNQ
ncbi:hypothetical protein LQ567_01485 [Niabella pedocola]|uniref:Uncharacterized protein n=1 Tax=Niabella pedocola TaxID=1752077 RepID=A0ABS8PNP7_9BACT|nr:hypothetical protein [Niabella pedocola]MCD2421416.1 hypothetical protein [Niabella pedocola]